MNITLKRWQMFILVTMILISISISFILLIDFDKPSYYNLLFILPLVFALYLFVYARLFRSFFDNLGATIITGLLFVRLVISPFFKFLSGYIDKITLNVEFNTPISIMLVTYETIAVMTTLFLLENKNLSKDKKNSYNIYSFPTNNKYIFIVFILVLLQLFIFLYTPGLLEGYRSVFNIKEKTFTHLEQTHIISKYATNFSSKLSLVTGSYLMKLLKLLLPSFLIVWINQKKKSKCRLILSYIIILTQFFMIDGTIARTIIYSLILFILINHIYSYNRKKQMAKILVVSAIIIIIYWSFRFSLIGGKINSYFSLLFSSYFSGVNIVSGSLNLSKDFATRLHYFLYDFLKSIPYGNTIFGLEKSDMQIYFNLINNTNGQIPTTIGSGYYYFGFLLAPIYSVIFTILAYKMGQKANQTFNLISKVRYLFLAITFSMGIIMYNVQITLTNFFSVAVPMYLIERFAYKNNENFVKNLKPLELKNE